MFPNLPSRGFRPRRIRPGGFGNWTGHLPFACDAISELRPGLLVELGTHYGESYFGFCQAIEQHDVGCLAYAVDSWQGDMHSDEYGEEVFTDVSGYNRSLYSSFSTLLRMTFDEASSCFSDATIDMFHIDGLHTYEAASRDFEKWLPKVRKGGLILLHDIAEREREFGVWRLWEEVRERFPSFEFHHSHGLGVIAKAPFGHFDSPLLEALFGNPAGSQLIRDYYSGCAERLQCGLPTQEPRVRCQVFFPERGVYSEVSSATAYFQPKVWSKFNFEGIGDGICRIDPMDSAGIVEIDGLSVQDPSNDMVLWAFDPSQLERISCKGTSERLCDNKRLLAVSYGPDPQIYLPAIHNPRVRLSFWMRIDPDLSAVARLLGEHARDAAETTELRRVIAEAKGEYSQLIARFELMQAERDELVRRNTQGDGDRKELARRMELVEAERDELVRRNAQGDGEREELARRMELVEAERDELVRRNTQGDGERKELARRMELVEAERDELVRRNTQGDGEREELARRMELLEAERDELVRRNTQGDGDRKELARRMELVEAERDELVRRNAQGDGEREELARRMELVEAERDELVRRNTQGDGEREELARRMELLEAVRDELVRRNEQGDGERQNLVLLMQSLQGERDELVRRRARVEAECAYLNGRVDALQAEREDPIRRNAHGSLKAAAATEALITTNQELTARVTALENSYSWRITAPLRRLFSLFISIRGNS